MNLLDAQLGEEYIIRAIETDDEEMDAFLFSLGCYSGEPITVISRKRGGHQSHHLHLERQRRRAVGDYV